MNKIFRFVFLILVVFFVISCGSTPKSDSVAEVENEKNDEFTIPEDETEEVEVLEEEIQYLDEDEVMDVEDEVFDLNVPDEEEEEYIRSTNNLSSDEVVSKEEFTDDKAEILRIINELQDVMDDGDVNAWLKYIAPDSIKYYSSPANIRKAQKKLPNKTIVLNGIGDYFKYVFIPSRKRSEVKEIRYISKNEIKAVDVKEDGGIVVYYQFVKKNNKWLVHIPTL